MLKRCESRTGFFLLGLSALLIVVAFVTLFDQKASDTSPFFGLCMVGFIVGIPGLFLCLRATPSTPVYSAGLTGWLHKTLMEMACCGSVLASSLNAIALIFFGTMLLMLVDAWVNHDANAQSGAIGMLIMTGLAGLLGRVTCKPRMEQPVRPHTSSPARPVARSLGNFKVVRIACPSCNASIPAELLATDKSHLTCPYCGSDVVVQKTET